MLLKPAPDHAAVPLADHLFHAGLHVRGKTAVFEQAVTHVSLRQVGFREVTVLKVGVGDGGSGELTVLELAPAHIRHVHRGAAENALGERRVVHVKMVESGVGEVGARELGFTDGQLVGLHVCHVSFSERGVGDGGVVGGGVPGVELVVQAVRRGGGGQVRSSNVSKVGLAVGEC